MRRGLGWAALAAAVLAIAGTRMLVSSEAAPVDRLERDGEARTAAAMLAGAASAPAVALPADTSRKRAPALPAERVIARRDDLELRGGAFQKVRPGSDRFVRVEGSAVGFERVALPPLHQALQPGVNQLAPLAAGDVDGDGWPEVAVGTAHGLLLYANTGGRFALERSEERRIVSYVALTDLSGDGAPDLFSCAWRAGCRIAWNRDGRIGDEAAELPAGDEAAVHSAAFADFDGDGRVDVVTGAGSELEWNFTPRSAGVTLWRNRGGGRFAPEKLPGPRGEALSLLATDLTGDGRPDLYAGNDFDEPSVVYANRRGRLVPLDRGDSPLPRATMSTMSLDSGDVDNDGRAEIYDAAISFGAMAPDALEERRQPPHIACQAVYAEGDELRDCLKLAEFQTAVVRSRDITDVTECERFTDRGVRADCAAAGHLWNELFADLPKTATKKVILEACARVPGALATIRDVCAQARGNPVDYGQLHKKLLDAIPQVDQTNLLFTPGRGGRFRDVTKPSGAGFGGWSWNAKFGDLDNDGRQDLFVAQGTRLRFGATSNHFYRNRGGMRFRDDADAAGLRDHVPTGGSLFVDVNMDGRLDLVTAPFALTPVLFGNDLDAPAGLQIALRDHTSDNTEAIGARVIIKGSDTLMQMREIKGSGGYGSADWTVARFGLGDWDAVTSVEVVWPDGERSVIDGLELRAGRYTLERGR